MINVGRWREDAKIHRCDCGGWVYADNPCGQCNPQIAQACAQTISTVLSLIPRARTGGVYGALYEGSGTVHAEPTDQLTERRTA